MDPVRTYSNGRAGGRAGALDAASRGNDAAMCARGRRAGAVGGAVSDLSLSLHALARTHARTSARGRGIEHQHRQSGTGSSIDCESARARQQQAQPVSHWARQRALPPPARPSPTGGRRRNPMRDTAVRDASRIAGLRWKTGTPACAVRRPPMYIRRTRGRSSCLALHCRRERDVGHHNIYKPPLH